MKLTLRGRIVLIYLPLIILATIALIRVANAIPTTAPQPPAPYCITNPATGMASCKAP